MPRFVRALVRTAILIGIASPVFGQVADLQDITSPPRATRQAAAVKALPALVEASRIARDPARGGPAGAALELAKFGPQVAEGDRARVEIVGREPAAEAVSSAVARHGGEVIIERGKRTEILVPIAALEALARDLPTTHHIVPSGFGQVVLDFDGQGPTIMRDGPYIDAGYDGSGITIAVIDVGYNGLGLSQNSGDAPGGYTFYNYTNTSFTSAQSGNHGRFVVETIYDHAPGASYILMKIQSQTGAAAAVDQAASLGVDIISMSLGYFPEWEDGVSELSVAAQDAASQGILVFNSAGNSARLHWQGSFSDGDGDDYHSWNGAADEALQVTVQPQGSVSFSLSFDRDGGSQDYDLYLYNADATGLYAWSAQDGDAYEGLSWTNNSPFVLVCQLVVERMAGSGTDFEIFAGRTTVMDQYIVSESSVLAPSDASHANVISVGAVEQAQYGSSEGAANIQATYSSRGPTNGGQGCPDISAPTSTSTSFANSFTGTSCACPHASGLTAALWSANPAGTASQVRALLYQYADAKDWGAPGADGIYGRGGVNLPLWKDCNLNSYPDAFDIASGGSDDDNENGRPDECDPAGFAYGLLGPDLPPFPGFTLIATIDPSHPVAAPLAPVAGFDMVFGFDPAAVQIDSVTASPELVALLGGAPAELNVMVIGGAMGVRCNFGMDPTGGPLFVPLDVSTEMLVIEGTMLPSSPGGPTGPMEIAYEDQPSMIGLLVPAVQKVRIAAAGGGTADQPPSETVAFNFEEIKVARTAFSFQPGFGTLSDETGGVLVEYDPAAPDESFSLRWSARDLAEPSVGTTSMSAAISVDPAVLTVTEASPVGAIAALNPALFLVTIGTDGVAIDAMWSTAGMPYFFGLDGAQVADIGLETVAAGLLGNGDSVTSAVRFAAPAGIPTAQNRVVGSGIDETPRLDDGVVLLVALAPPAETFRRGDVDGSGGADIGDAINILGHLFLGASPPLCVDSADTNDDAMLTIADPVYLLGYLFNAGTPPPAPGPDACGPDTTTDSLDCLQGC